MLHLSGSQPMLQPSKRFKDYRGAKYSFAASCRPQQPMLQAHLRTDVNKVQGIENKAKTVTFVVMSSASSAVTYTSVYTDSEPGRVFWGADEEISDGGIPRRIRI
ncbi:hypothetical protein Tco_1370386 [Tanacetum coccineum]